MQRLDNSSEFKDLQTQGFSDWDAVLCSGPGGQCESDCSTLS
jgi:hypothetical protein